MEITISSQDQAEFAQIANKMLEQGSNLETTSKGMKIIRSNSPEYLSRLSDEKPVIVSSFEYKNETFHLSLQ